MRSAQFYSVHARRYVFVVSVFILFAAYRFNLHTEKIRDPLPFMIGHFLLNAATAVQISINTLFPDIFNAL